MNKSEYTPRKEKWINDKIDKDMRMVCDAILKVVDPISIILLGGFGRGEGSVVVNNSAIQPLKDYDLLLVMNEKINLSTLNKITSNAEQRLGYNKIISRNSFFSDFEISMLPITLHDLKHLGDIKAYEVKTASKVLYGEDVRERIKISAGDIPLSSGSRFLFNKVIGLLKRFSAAYLRKPPEESEKNCLIYECAKAYMDIGTALSLISKNFKPTYTERSRIIKENYEAYFPELARKVPDLDDKIAFFTELKLFPDRMKYEQIEAVKLWFDTRRDLGITLRYYMNQHLDITGEGWPDFAQECYRNMKKEGMKGMIRHYLENRFNVNSRLAVNAGNFMFQKYFSFKYMNNLRRNGINIPLTALTVFPYHVVLTASLPLLFSLDESGNLDNYLFKAFSRSIKRIYPLEFGSSDEPCKWDEAVERLLTIKEINRKVGYGFK